MGSLFEVVLQPQTTAGIAPSAAMFFVIILVPRTIARVARLPIVPPFFHPPVTLLTWFCFHQPQAVAPPFNSNAPLIIIMVPMGASHAPQRYHITTVAMALIISDALTRWIFQIEIIYAIYARFPRYPPPR